ncbi:MAG: hypothetical protein IT539_12785 [Bradyrhizobiaceae bacterium]|nr:hypothetical protein [Bradyrhizobiaceae bacterium]
MNAPIKIAQADTKTATKEQKIVKLTKPADGQAVTIELSYDQSIKVDFSEIANEKIIIVRIGERAVILFDNGSTVTLDPFFDSLRRPLANLEFEFAPGKVLTAQEIAGLVPFTDDQSVLPAAGEGDPREAGANFNPAIVEAIGPVVLNELMPPEFLPPIDFTADIAPAFVYAPLAFAGLLAIVEEDHLTKKGNLEGKYPFLSEGNEGPTSFNHDTGLEDDFDNDPSTIDGDDDTWQNFDNTTHQFKAQLVITGGSGSYSFSLLPLPDFDTIYQSKGDTIRVHIDPVTGELVGYVDNGSNDFGAGDRVVFTLELSPTGEIVFRIYDQLDHASLDGQPGDNEENNLVIDFSNVILVTDAGAGQSLLLEDIDLTVIDDVPVLTHKKEVQIVDEDDIKTFNDGLPGGSLGTSPNDGDGDGSYTGSPYNNLGGPATVFGTLAFTVKVGADEVYKKYGKGIAEFTFKDGDNTDLSYLYSLGLGSKGDDLRYDIQGNVLYGYAPNFNAGAVGYDEGIDRLVFKLTIELDGDYKFELYDQLDHDAPNDFFIDGVSAFPGADENFDLQDSIFGDVVFIDFGKLIKASDYDGDSIDLDGQLKIAVRDDVPEVKECDPIILKVDEDDIKTNLSKGNHPEDGDSDGSYTGDPNNENGGPATVFGSLAGPGGVVVSGADEPLTFSFVYNATNILQQLGLQSKGDELSYFVQNGVLYGYVNANLAGPFGPNDRIVFTFTLEDNGDFKFELFDQLDHDKPPYGADQNFDLQDDVPGDVYFIDFGKLINATDYDGDTVNLDNMLLIKIRDDIPEIKAGAKVSGVVEEEHLPQGNEDFTASPDLDEDHGSPTHLDHTTNAVSGSGANSLLSLVNVGADENGKFAFKSNLVNANIKTTGGADVTSGYAAVIVKSVVSGGSGSSAYQLLTAWNGANDIFTLKVYANGNWEFTLLDQIDHHPFGSADNLEGFLELDFSGLLKFTDFDGDTIKLDGAEFYVKVIDDIPTLKDLRTSGKDVQHDETQGIQNNSTDDDVSYASLPAAIKNLFDGVGVPGTDPDVSPKDGPAGNEKAIGYASSGGSIVSFTSSVGTDQPGSVDLDLILSSQGTFSGLQTTDGRNIYLYKEGDVIVGRYDQPGDGNTIIDANDPAAFAIAIGDNGTVYLVQWVSLKHNDSPNNYDEDTKIADGKVKVLVTVTDSDGDKTSGTVDISSKIRFDDDGPDTDGNNLVQLDDDDLDGGNPGGVNDNPNATPINVSGTLSHDYGSDGPGTVLFTGASLPGGFSSSITGGGTILTISQNGTPVLKVTLTNTTSGEYEVEQLAAIKHPDGNNENNVEFTLNYRVTDGDFDRASGTLKINVDDDTPIIPSGTLTVYLDDEAATDTYGTPNTGGTDDQDPNIVNASGVLPHLYGADGAGSLVLLGAGLPAHDPGNLLGEGAFTQAVTGGGTLLTIYQVQNGVGVAVLEVSLTNTSDGAYSVEQLNPVFHPTPGTSEEEQTFNISYRVTDSDNDSVDGSFAIKVDDDTPVIESTDTGSIQIVLDETVGPKSGDANPTIDDALGQTLVDGEMPFGQRTIPAASVAALFSVSFGADGPKASDALLYLLTNAGGGLHNGTLSGLYVTGDTVNQIKLYDNNGVIEGWTGNAIGEGTLAFAIGFDGNGDIIVQQFHALHHLVVGSTSAAHDDSVFLRNLVFVTATATDADNDSVSKTSSTSLEIEFQDDGPLAVDDPAQTVDEGGAQISGNVLTNDTQGSDDATLTHVWLPDGLGGYSGITDITTGTPLGGGVYEFVVAGVGTFTFKADGNWTFTPVAAVPSNTIADFAYRITDGDGDYDDADQPISIINVDTPFGTPDPFVGIVEEEHLNNMNAAFPGDGSNIQGSKGNEDTTASPDEDNDTPGDFNVTTNITSGTLAITGGDGTRTWGYEVADGTPVRFTLGGIQVLSKGIPVYFVRDPNDATILYGVANDDGDPHDLETDDRIIFKIELDTTDGSFVFTLLDQIDHHPYTLPPPGGPIGVDNQEGIMTIDLGGVFNVVDEQYAQSQDPADKHVFQNVKVEVIDDIPVAFTPEAAELENSGVSGTSDAQTFDLEFAEAVGADEIGNVVFTLAQQGVPAKDKNGNDLFLGGEQLFLFTEDNGHKLVAKTGDGDIGFTVTLDVENDTYTVDLEGTIRNGEEFSFDVQANGISGGNSNGYALTQSVTLPSDGIIITGALGAAQATVNSSNGRLAVGNAQSIGSNEFIRFDFVTGITVDNTAPISQSGFNFGTYNPVNYISQQVVQTQSGDPTTLVIRAYNTDHDQTLILDPNGDVPVPLTAAAVKVYSSDPTQPGAVQILSGTNGLTITENGGIVTVAGMQQGWYYEVTSDQSFEALEVAYGGGATFDLGDISIRTVNTLDPFDISLPILAMDEDGDTVQSTIEIGINPPPPPPLSVSGTFAGTVEEEHLQPASATSSSFAITASGNEDEDDAGLLDTDVDPGNFGNVTNVKTGTFVVTGGDGSYVFAFDAANFEGEQVQKTVGGGLTSGGDPVLYHELPSGVVIGYVDESGGGAGYDEGVDRVIFSLEITADGNYTFTLYDKVDHPTPTSGGPATEENIEIDLGSVISVTDGVLPAIPLSGSITVIDDVPEAQDDSAEVTEGGNEVPSFHLTYLIDVSASISDAQMVQALTAFHSMTQAYIDAGANFSVELIRFRGQADAAGTRHYDTPAEINTLMTLFTNSINNINGSIFDPGTVLGSGTNYEAGLISVRNYLNTVNGADGFKNVFYFFTDGDPTAGSITETNISTMSTFMAVDPAGAAVSFNQLIDDLDLEIHAFGVGSVSAAGANLLDVLDNTNDSPISLATFEDMLPALLGTVGDLNAISGNVLLGNNGIDDAGSPGGDDDGFGADGGYIKSVEIDGRLYTFDGNNTITPSGTADPGHALVTNGGKYVVVTTALGGTLTFHFADNGSNDAGDWAYSAPEDVPDNDQETFTYYIIDGDGDTASATLTIDVLDVPEPDNLAPTPQNDIVLKNWGGTAFNVPEWAFLANDTDPDGDPLDISQVVPGSPSGLTAVHTAGTGTNGFITIDGDNTNSGPSNDGSFQYIAHDGTAGTNASVTVTQDQNSITGTSSDEIFVGDNDGDTFTGNGGLDVFLPGGGTDTINSGTGNDIFGFDTNDGSNTINDAGGTNDRIYIMAAGSALTALNFIDDNTDGDDGNLDITVGSTTIAVNNHFDGTAGVVESIRFLGGATFGGYDLGSDPYVLSTDQDSNRQAPAGVNTILAGDNNDETLTGNTGNDLLFGNGGNDTLNGGDGNDLLIGGSGDDTLNGGAGADVMLGESGNDLFVADTNDIIDGGTHSSAINASRGDVLVMSGVIDFTALPDNFTNIETLSMLNSDGSVGTSTFTLDVNDVKSMSGATHANNGNGFGTQEALRIDGDASDTLNLVEIDTGNWVLAPTMSNAPAGYTAWSYVTSGTNPSQNEDAYLFVATGVTVNVV